MIEVKECLIMESEKMGLYMRIKIVWKTFKSGNIPNNLSKKPTIVYEVACVKYIIRLFRNDIID